MSLKQTISAIALFASMLMAGTASAASYSFYNITGNSSTDLSGQLSLDVSELGGQALFTIANASGGLASSITQIYFDFGSTSLFAIPNGINFSATNSSATGVKYENGSNPGVLPGGKTVGFTVDDSGSAQSGPGGVMWNGVNPGEYVGFLGTFTSGSSFSALLSALNSGDFRVGLHVQAIAPGDKSDSYVNVSPVPLPAAAWLFGSALIGFISLSNRRKV